MLRIPLLGRPKVPLEQVVGPAAKDKDKSRAEVAMDRGSGRSLYAP